VLNGCRAIINLTDTITKIEHNEGDYTDNGAHYRHTDAGFMLQVIMHVPIADGVTFDKA